MVLSRSDILHYLREGKLKFDPPVTDDRVAQVSVDLKLGRKFTVFKEKPGYLSAVNIDPSLWSSEDLWEHYERDTYRLIPGRIVLAQTLERISIPENLVGLVEGRSSWARAGVSVHVTAPKIDPGFDGHITLEMANLSSVPVDLRADTDQPAQLILLNLTTPLPEEDLYGRREVNHFQGQTTPIPSKK